MDLHDLDRTPGIKNRHSERRRVERRRMIVFVEHDRRAGADRRTGIDRRKIGRWPRLAVPVTTRDEE